ncbi:MAG: 3-deoxy-7-phosphoheptulonate synthase [Parachlamydiales bacterium]|nr:3-deoxy-7-phosphoheptulonate synthase [Candidatus Acheromyda pituitae]
MHSTPLPSIQEIKQLFPIHSHHMQFIAESRIHAKAILNGTDKRKVVIVGPCSIHDKNAAIEYAKRFKKLSHEVSKSLFLVMRVYVEKPRTITGWKGLIYDPHLDGSHDIQTGLIWTRELMMALTEMKVPIATEFVDPLAAYYVQDLITWGFIGARTSASQPHRQLASALKIPTGFKNSTDGNLDHAVNGVISAKTSHCFMNIDEEGHLCSVQSDGNPWSHIVLRGSQETPNYDAASVRLALQKLKNAHLSERIMIDCSHGNCQKDHEKQASVFRSVFEQIEGGNDSIFGAMLESHLESGSQLLPEDPALLRYATSITDPCIDWQTTEELIYSASEGLSSSLSSSLAGS